MFLDNGVFAHSSRSDPFLSSLLYQFWSSCSPFGDLLWLLLVCSRPFEGPCWILFGVIFVVFWCGGGVWGVCLA